MNSKNGLEIFSLREDIHEKNVSKKMCLRSHWLHWQGVSVVNDYTDIVVT